jgi:hypothetical protein
MMDTSFSCDLLHLYLHFREHFEDLTQLVLSYNEDVALTVDNCGAISAKVLVVGEHHFHFSEVSALCIHIERYNNLRCSRISRSSK